MRTISYDFNLNEKRTMILKFPDDIPLGRHQMIVIIDENLTNSDEDRFDEE